MIEIKNLTKRFGQTKILDDISFTVNKGEILGFLGPNGAGKSTTMKIITGFWTPNQGTVKVEDMDIINDSMEIRRKIGYLPETVPLYDDMRVYEYLKFVAEVRGVGKGDLRERIKEVVTSCGLQKVLLKPIDELSKGYRQRVGLAQAIMHQPDILILDEPTTGLDPNQIVEIRELIKKIGREKTVIFSTHILSEVSATCDRAIIINNGRIVGEGSPSDLLQTAGGKEILYLKIKGPREEILKVVSAMEGVLEITEKGREEDGIFSFEVTLKPGADLRAKLADQIIRQGWELYDLSRKQASMEDVFRELTK